jgi:hypothetical protein
MEFYPSSFATHSEAEVEKLRARLDSLMEAHFAQPDPRRLELEAEVERLHELAQGLYNEVAKLREAGRAVLAQ